MLLGLCFFLQPIILITPDSHNYCEYVCCNYRQNKAYCKKYWIAYRVVSKETSPHEYKCCNHYTMQHVYFETDVAQEDKGSLV